MRKVLWVSLLLFWCSLFISCMAVLDHLGISQHDRDMARIERDPEYIKLKKEEEFAQKKVNSHREMLQEVTYYAEVDGEWKNVLSSRRSNPNYEIHKKTAELHEKKMNEWLGILHNVRKKMRALEDRKLKEYEEARKRKAAEEEEEGNGGGGY